MGAVWLDGANQIFAQLPSLSAGNKRIKLLLCKPMMRSGESMTAATVRCQILTNTVGTKDLCTHSQVTGFTFWASK